MAAECRLCLVNYQTTPNPQGIQPQPNSPIATCFNCRCLICAYHGQFDTLKGEFWCTFCDIVFAAGSAGNQGQVPALDLATQAVHADFDGKVNWLESADEFARRRPAYGPKFFGQVESHAINLEQQRWSDPNTATELGDLPTGAQDLLVVAALLSRNFVPEQERLRFIVEVESNLVQKRQD